MPSSLISDSGCGRTRARPRTGARGRMRAHAYRHRPRQDVRALPNTAGLCVHFFVILVVSEKEVPTVT